MPIKEGIEYGVNEALSNLMSKPIRKEEPKQNWLQRMIMTGAMAENPAVMTASGYRPDKEKGIIQDKVNDEYVKRLRQNLVGIGAAGAGAMAGAGTLWKVTNNPYVSAGFDVATGNYGDAAVGLATDILPFRKAFNIFKNAPGGITEDLYDAYIDAYGHKEILSKMNPTQQEAIQRVLNFYDDPEYVKRFEQISDKSNIDKFKRAINGLTFKINYGLKNGYKKKITGGSYKNGEVTLNPDFADNITVNVHEIGHGSTDSGRLLPEEVLKHNSNFIPKIKPSIKKRMELDKDLYKDVMYHLEPDELRARGIEIKTLMNEYGIDVNKALQKWSDLNYGNTSLKYFNKNSLKRYVNNFLGVTPVVIGMNMETKQAE